LPGATLALSQPGAAPSQPAGTGATAPSHPAAGTASMTTTRNM